MALSDEAKQKLDDALAAAVAEGHTIFGAIVSADNSELQPFGNCGDNPQAWVHNMDTAVNAVRETITQPPHEA